MSKFLITQIKNTSHYNLMVCILAFAVIFLAKTTRKKPKSMLTKPKPMFLSQHQKQSNRLPKKLKNKIRIAGSK